MSSAIKESTHNRVPGVAEEWVLSKAESWKTTEAHKEG